MTAVEMRMRQERSGQPGFSVVMPVFNGAGTIGRALDSILHQSYSDFEVIVVDDGSEDNTGQVVEKFIPGGVVCLRTDHAGVCAARNEGIRAAGGKYITFLDSDDQADGVWLESLYNTFNSNPGTGLVFCGAKIVDEGTSGSCVMNPWNLGPIFRHQSGVLLPGCFAVRADVLKESGGYDEGLAYSENTELVIRLIEYCFRNNLGIVTLHTPLIVYHRGRNNVKKNYYEKRSAAVVHIIDKHRALFNTDKNMLAVYYAIAGVDSARLKRNSLSRHFFLQAVKADPAGIRHMARLLMMLMPPLARLIWKRHQK